MSVTGEFLSQLDKHAFALRPVWRREESGVDTTCRKAQVVDDLTRVTLSSSSSSSSSSSGKEEAGAEAASLCVEIKVRSAGESGVDTAGRKA